VYSKVTTSDKTLILHRFKVAGIFYCSPIPSCSLFSEPPFEDRKALTNGVKPGRIKVVKKPSARAQKARELYVKQKEFSSTESIYNEATGFIETFSGKQFHPIYPQFCVDDIAHALGMNCRFNGHCRKFYSVAEHSVLVSSLMDAMSLGDPFEGLMHDASEAYLSDVPAPFKQYLPELGEYDRKVDLAIRETFKLPPSTTVECKRCDWMALFIEAYWLLPSKGETFHDPYNLRNRALEFKDEFEPFCFAPEVAVDVFRNAYKNLSKTRTNVPQLS
jgi:uncharacterized protein